MASKIRFSKAKEFDFYSTINKRVEDYFVKIFTFALLVKA
jgi:hypothetical protein